MYTIKILKVIKFYRIKINNSSRKMNIYLEYNRLLICRLFNNIDSTRSLREELEINSIYLKRRTFLMAP